MEIMTLTDTPEQVDFFQQCVLNNLAYWHRQVRQPTPDGPSTDDERGNILRAISFGLDLGGIAWPVTFSLIEAYTSQMERWGFWEEWGQILRRAVIVARQVGDETGVVSLSALLARLLYQQSRNKESIQYYRQTIRLARQIGDKLNEARACSNMGYYFAEQGFWNWAEVLCCHALNLFEQLDHNHGRAHTENHLGILYTRQRRWSQARQRLEQASNIWRLMEDNYGIMLGFLNLGLLYLGMEQPEAALQELKQGLIYGKLAGEERLVGTIHMNIGLAHLLAGRLATAKKETLRAETIFKRYAYTMGLAQVWTNLGMIFLYQEQWDEAEVYLKRALQKWRSLSHKRGEIETLSGLIEYELARGNVAQAATRLNEVEDLISRETPAKYHYLQPRLVKFRSAIAQSSR